MANVAIGEFLEVKLYGVAADQVGINAVHYQVSTIIGAMSEGALLEAISLAVAPLYAPLISANAQYFGASLQKVFPLPKRASITTTTGRGNGTNVGDLLPRQTAGLVTKRSAGVGRAGRGRFYAFFPSEFSSSAQGHPTPAYVVSLTALANQLFTSQTYSDGGLNSAVLQPIIFHRAAPNTSPSVTSSVPRPLWATQKRRGDYGRQNPAPF